MGLLICLLIVTCLFVENKTKHTRRHVMIVIWSDKTFWHEAYNTLKMLRYTRLR